MPFTLKERLQLDYEKTLGAIDKYDGHVQEIKNWSLTVCGGVLLFGLKEKSVAITMLTGFIAIGFCFVALICKALIIGAREHAKKLEILIQTGTHRKTAASVWFGPFDRKLVGLAKSV